MCWGQPYGCPGGMQAAVCFPAETNVSRGKTFVSEQNKRSQPVGFIISLVHEYKAFFQDLYYWLLLHCFFLSSFLYNLCFLWVVANLWNASCSVVCTLRPTQHVTGSPVTACRQDTLSSWLHAVQGGDLELLIPWWVAKIVVCICRDNEDLAGRNVS